MKKFVVIFITLIILGTINYLGATWLKQDFIELSFLVGLLGVVVIRFFNSSGGFTSRRMDMQIQARTGIKMEQEQKSFNPNIAFYTAIGYTIIAIIATFIAYKYF